LKPDASDAAIADLCAAAAAYPFAAICVNPSRVALCAARRGQSSCRLATVVGFPLGAATTAVKCFEADDALHNGATELDMVINIGAARSGAFSVVADDIRQVRAATAGACLKVILETCYFTDQEKITLCHIVQDAGADFVKTSTGFGPAGATEQDVRLLRETVGATLGVKAAGGIRTAAEALRMIAAGATRIGTSQGVAILQELQAGEPICG
jgi:deoxyribose-phosphate aldolase